MSDGWRVEEPRSGARLALAVLGALVLVAVGLVIRSRLGDDDSGSGGSGGDADALVCPEDLAEVCEAAVGDDMTVRIEAPLDTTTALIEARSADDVDPGLWLVPRSWAEAVAAERSRGNDDPLIGDPVGPVARSPAVILAYEERAAALDAGACDGAVTWRCLGEVAGEPWDGVGGDTAWGTVRAGVSDPASASGLVVLGAAVGGYLDMADYATNDLDDPALSGWLRDLGGTSAEAGDDAVTRMVTRGAGELALLGTTEASARIAAPRIERDEMRMIVPEPTATVDLVVVPIGDTADAADDLAGNEALLDALAEAGWRVDGHDLAEGLDPDVELPDNAGVPRGEVLRAALTRWQDAT